jgi:hypothetical protein
LAEVAAEVVTMWVVAEVLVVLEPVPECQLLLQQLMQLQ